MNVFMCTFVWVQREVRGGHPLELKIEEVNHPIWYYDSNSSPLKCS